MTLATKPTRPMTEKDLEALQLIVASLPTLPEFMLQRWAGAVEAVAALRAEEEKPEKPAS